MSFTTRRFLSCQSVWRLISHGSRQSDHELHQRTKFLVSKRSTHTRVREKEPSNRSNVTLLDAETDTYRIVRDQRESER